MNGLLRPRRRWLLGLALASIAAGVGARAFETPGALWLIPLFALVAAAGPWIEKNLEAKWLRRRARGLTDAEAAAGSYLLWDDWQVSEATRGAVDADLSAHRAGEESGLVLGHFDADGRLCTPYGELPGLSCFAGPRLEARKRRLALVLMDGRLLVRKDFGGDALAFLREWHHLSHLRGHARVPAVARVDEARHRLYKAFLPGPTLRAALAAAGARILTVDTRCDPELAALAPVARLEAVWARGRAYLESCVGKEFRDRLEREVEAVHGRGISGLSLTFGNILIAAEDRQPWLIDFESARAHKWKWSPSFLLRRQRDRSKFRRIYGRRKVPR